MCARVCVWTHKGSFPALSLIDVTYLLPGRTTIMYIMQQFVCVSEYIRAYSRFKHMDAWSHALRLC